MCALLVSLAGLPGRLAGQSLLDYSNYNTTHPVFEDNFDYTSVAELKAKWRLVDPRDSLQQVGDEYYSPDQISFPGGGIVRLTARRITPFTDTVRVPGRAGQPDTFRVREYYYKSGKIESAVDIDGPDADWSDPGIAYGMFEIRCRLPVDSAGQPLNAAGVWPTFWLYSGPTEIDVIDNLKPRPARQLQSGVIDWRPAQQTPPKPKIECGKIITVGRRQNLAASFNTYTMVWTPTEVAFFLNGKELYTVDSTCAQTSYWRAKMIVNLQMRKWAAHTTNGTGQGVEQAHYDIDYIRVYKPKYRNSTEPYHPKDPNYVYDYSLPYKKPAPARPSFLERLSGRAPRPAAENRPR